MPSLYASIRSLMCTCPMSNTHRGSSHNLARNKEEYNTVSNDGITKEPNRHKQLGVECSGQSYSY